MSRHDEREITRRLADTPAGEPPPELLDRLRGDIPEDLTADMEAGDQAGGPPAAPTPFTRPRLAAAATLVMLVAGGFLAWKLTQEVGPVGESYVDGPPAAESTADTAGSAEGTGTGEAVEPTGSAKATAEPAVDPAGEVTAEEHDRNESRDRAAPAGDAPPVELTFEDTAIHEEQPMVEEAAPAPPTGDQAASAPGTTAAPPPAPPSVPQVARLAPPSRPAGHQQGRQAAESRGRQASPEPEEMADRAAGERSELQKVAGPAPTSPVEETAQNRLSTFGLDVDSGSFSLLRAHLEAGRMPPAAAVRVEEVVNAQPFSDPFAEAPARPGETFRVTADGAPSPFAPDRSHRLLRFRISARELTPAEGKPVRDGTLQAVAEEARAQVELDPRVVESWRQVGYENRAIADHEFRYDAVDAGEIGPGHSVTALYEVKLRAEPAPGRPLALLKLRWREPAAADGTADDSAGRFREIEERLTAEDLAASWSAANPDLRLAAVAAELAEHLRGSPHATSAPSTLLTEARRLAAAGVSGAAELVELAEAWRRLDVPAADAEEPGDD